MVIKTTWVPYRKWETPFEREVGITVRRTEVHGLDCNAHYKHRAVYINVWWGFLAVHFNWGVRADRCNNVPLA